MTPDDGIECPRARGGSEVDAHLVDGGRFRVFGVAFVRRAGLAEHLNGLGAHLLQVDAQTFQHAGGDTLALAHETKQQVFCSDIVMIQTTSFINGQLDHLFGAWSQTNFAQHDAVSTSNNKFNGAANLVQFNAQITQYFGGNALSLTYQTKQEMLGADIIVLEALRFFLSQAQNLSGSFGKSIKPISIVHLFVTPLSVAESGTVPSMMLR